MKNKKLMINEDTSSTEHICYTTDMGTFYHGLCEDVLRNKSFEQYKGKVQLIFTSPPFPLNRKKKYGNLQGSEYVAWLSNFASLFKEFLSPDGSIVMELGNAWNNKSPTVSTLPLETLLSFKSAGNLHLCQEFICFNPARLPSPAQWVTIERIRVKDSFTRLWWFSSTPRPKANNLNILTEYSDSMKKLLKSGKYNSGKRPSEHVISENSFLKDNGGAIPPNVLTVANTNSNDPYLKYCKEHGLESHPARMPSDLATFFIKFLTDENDLVMDPFAGSNVTGIAAEKLGRQWISIDPDKEYIKGSVGRFINSDIKTNFKM